jgi:ABC-type branched-subunit amino acid transport system ATPase component/ABC-type branched-subunit amino acid transport system permease subunit
MVDHRAARLLVLLAGPLVLVAIFIVPLTSGPFGLQLGTLIAVYTLAAVGVDAIVGRGGLLHIGYGLVFGVGAYTVVVTAQHWDGPLVVSLLGGALLAAGSSVLLGFLLRRSSGYLFAVLTLAAAAAVASIVNNASWLGGTAGLGGVSRDLLGLGDISDMALYVLVCVVAAIAVGLYTRFRYTATGRAIEAVRLVPNVAEASGVDIANIRQKLTILSGLLGGLAGGLYAVLQQYVNSDVIGLSASVNLLAINIIGGSTVALGGLPGAYIVIGLPQHFQGLVSYQLILLGAVMLCVALGFRRGVAGTLGDAWLRVVRPLWQRPQPDSSETSEEGTGVKVPQLPQHQAGEAFLTVSNASVEFGGLVALSDVSLTLEAGTVHALVGPNGAGKSTLVGVIAGQLRRGPGRIELLGEDISSLRPEERTAAGITRTFQLVALCETLTVVENVMLGGHTSAQPSFTRDFVGARPRTDEHTLRERAMSLLEVLGVDPLAAAHPPELTSGHQRLVEIARCLMSEARVILLDEPAAGLSTHDRQQLARVITRLAAEGRAIMLIEHDMEFVMSVADTMTVLSRGRVLAAGAPDTVRSDPTVVEAYWGRAVAA